MTVKRSRVGKAFGVVLRRAREDAGVTQEQLAAKASYGANYISMLERAARQPTISAVLALENGLGLDPGELVRRTAVLARDRKKP
jgi:transcriptional regulator with XRE-family HTH domain